MQPQCLRAQNEHLRSKTVQIEVPKNLRLVRESCLTIYSGIATHGAGVATHVDTVDLYR